MKAILFSVLLLVLVGGVFAQDADTVVIDVPEVMPEGVDYDAVGERFLFGSLSTGSIYQVNMAGEAEVLIEDADLQSSVGIQVDSVTNRLLVTNSDVAAFSDPDVMGFASLAAYDLATGERLFLTDLGGLVAEESQHFANDVAVDEEGYAYVTDTFVPVIYEVDPEGNAEILVEDDQLGSLNGIDYHPDGYLLVAAMDSGALLKVTLDDEPTVTPVALDQFLIIDGLILTPEGDTLYAVVYTMTGSQDLVEITSEDDWVTATVTAQVETGGNATTVTLQDGQPFYINAYLNNPAQTEYEIVAGVFE